MNFQPGRIIMLVLATTLLGGCALFGEAGDDGRTTLVDVAILGADLETCRRDAVVTEGVVWLSAGAESDEIAGLDGFLAGSPEVVSYRYSDSDDHYERFVEYYADEPEVLDLIDADQLPVSFEVVLDDQADVAGTLGEIEQFSIVESIDFDPDNSTCFAEAAALQVACDQPPSEWTVWLQPEVGQATVDAVAAVLAQSPQIAEAHYVDLDETAAEFETYWADDQEILDLVDLSTLPTSFTATLTAEVQASADWEAEIDELRTALLEIDGVDNTERASSEISEACWEAIDGGALARILAESE